MWKSVVGEVIYTFKELKILIVILWRFQFSVLELYFRFNSSGNAKSKSTYIRLTNQIYYVVVLVRVANLTDPFVSLYSFSHVVWPLMSKKTADSIQPPKCLLTCIFVFSRLLRVEEFWFCWISFDILGIFQLHFWFAVHQISKFQDVKKVYATFFFIYLSTYLLL